MLGNKDFSQLVSSGSLNGNGKVKFDLKQVSKWDRENNKALHRKKVENFKEKEKKEDDWTTFGYRDRADERRKGINVEDEKLDETVSQLDTDKTKILGGDVDHTHLVRGLDFTLLKKVRQDLECQKNVSSIQEVEHTAPVVEQPKQLFTTINIGTHARIPGLNMPVEAPGKSVVDLKVTKKVADEYAPSKKKRKEVEAIASEPVIPPPKKVITAMSIYDDVEKYVPVGAIDEATGEALKPVDNSTSNSNNSSSARVGSSIFSLKSGFGSNSSTNVSPPTSSSNSSSMSGFVKSSSSAKTGLFDGVYDTAKVNTSNSNVVPSQDDLMKPVMALLNAQANKEKAALDRLNNANNGTMARNNKIIIEKDSEGNQLVHRDVFATTLDKVVKGTTIVGLNGKEGEMFGLKGTYNDIYPESNENEDEFSDGEEKEDSGTTMKKPAASGGSLREGGDRGSVVRGSAAFSGTAGMEGSFKKGLVKTGATPWRSHGPSHSEAAGSRTQSRPMHSGATAAGMNRAARRAANG